MERLDDFSTFLQNFDTLSSTNDDSGEDLENEIDDNQYLISHRIPVSVYKYPIDGTFGGSMFQGKIRMMLSVNRKYEKTSQSVGPFVASFELLVIFVDLLHIFSFRD